MPWRLVVAVLASLLCSAPGTAGSNEQSAHRTVAETRDGRVCRSSDECDLGHCSSGTCQCPVLVGGEAAAGTCRGTTYHWCLPALPEIRGKRAALLLGLCRAAEESKSSKTARWLAAVFSRAHRTVSSADMGHFTLHRGNTMGLSMLGLDKPPVGHLPAEDLPERLDVSSCAVVGSSAALLRRRDGPTIDSHGTVIRFNQAPTKGFEAHVGSRTTLRLQNSYTAGFSEHQGEICLVRLSSAGKKNKDGQKLASIRQGAGCHVTQLSPQFEAYRRMLWFNQAPPHASKWSSGFMGTALAANLCTKVTLYGFDFGTEYYFDKEHRKKDSGTNQGKVAEGHPWALERSCTEALASLPSMVW
eukprot:CAMPEP_0117668824 /NCGR_PEP_ID=MMETSP0804-20121206/11773_1 /TAXON_ID=1074897 /ORGANISM="Tetraselmis astigmatica, Strain CCMP880" /LENGTH=357 /DNA_ID=CAMNT_0005476777 /DNA_START=52 /DNA_END=1122 /DNA_ORIENTATION=-